MIKLLKSSLIFFFSFILLSIVSYSQESKSLLIKFEDTNSIVRENIAEDLGKVKPSDEKTILALIKHFADDDLFVRGKAIEAIVRIGDQTLNFLTESLTKGSDEVRLGSAIALYKIAPKGVKAVPFLINALADKNQYIRWCSAIALGQFHAVAEPAVSELQKLLNDEDRDVRWAAYVSLTKIKKEALNINHDYSNVIQLLDNITSRVMKELKVPGVSICIIKDFRLDWSQSFGISDVNKQTKVNNETVFEACSMSKPVFTYLVLKLVEQGKLDLDKPLSNYLTEKFVAGNDDYSKRITARMILTHTSGMPNWRKAGDEIGAPLPVYFNPGSKFNYSGEGIFYLQRVVEKITQQPLDRFAKSNLFDKLGLKSTSFVWTEDLNPRIATGHDSSANCNKRSMYRHANAAYTLYTTAEEYAKFIVAIMSTNKKNEYLLSDQMFKEMLSHQVRSDVREVIDRPGHSLGLTAYRGLGWGIDSTITGDIAYHSGSNQTGFKCYSQFNIKEGSGIVIMTNGENGSELWHRLISIVGDL